MRLTTRDLARIRDLRYGDGLTCEATAAIVGCCYETVRKYAPGRPGSISNAPLREAFESSGKSAADIARAIGWTYTQRVGGKSYLAADTSRVRRVLGLREHTSSRDGVRRRTRQSSIDAEMAAGLAEAIGISPWEIGA